MTAPIDDTEHSCAPGVDVDRAERRALVLVGVVVVPVVVAMVVGRVMGDGPGVTRDVAAVLVCGHRLVSNLRRTFWHGRRP